MDEKNIQWTRLAETKSIYEDIFEGGYIQSVTRVKTEED